MSGSRGAAARSRDTCDFLAGAGCEQVGDGAAAGHTALGRDFGQRREHERA